MLKSTTIDSKWYEKFMLLQKKHDLLTRDYIVLKSRIDGGFAREQSDKRRLEVFKSQIDRLRKYLKGHSENLVIGFSYLIDHSVLGEKMFKITRYNNYIDFQVKGVSGFKDSMMYTLNLPKYNMFTRLSRKQELKLKMTQV